MVENADSRPLIGRPSFDSTPLLIENRRSRRSSSRFTQFNFTAILFLCAEKGLLLIFTAKRRSGGAVADGFEKRPFFVFDAWIDVWILIVFFTFYHFIKKTYCLCAKD